MNQDKTHTKEKTLHSPLTLNSGQVISNRIVKAAMHESMGSNSGKPLQSLIPLYKTWAQGGAGLSITGNVMIDSKARSEPGNVIVENKLHLELLKRWALAGNTEKSQLWMQINHPGKQAMLGLNKENIAPSAIPFKKELAPYFPTPREIQAGEIEELLIRFAYTACIAKEAGFTGIQIHAAHGYLINQFLSPHHNRRKDKWGGTATNRRRFMLSVYHSIREAVGSNFSIGIKLNSADFQKGGYEEGESMETVLSIADAGIDMIEISGGTYESPAFTGTNQTEHKSKNAREAYFLDFAENVRKQTSVPLMVTGGFRTYKGMENALQSDALDFVGLARLLSIDPHTPHKLLEGRDPCYEISPRTTGIRAIDKSKMMEIVWYTQQLNHLAKKGKSRPDESVLKVAACYMLNNILSGKFALPKFRAG